MRYVILIALNTPIILVALLNFLTKYKMNRISKERFKVQFTLWLLLLAAVICSYPIYNTISGKSAFESSELSLFDILQTTAVIFLLYALNTQRQKLENTEKTLRDLHQELSIILSDEKTSKR